MWAIPYTDQTDTASSSAGSLADRPTQVYHILTVHASLHRGSEKMTASPTATIQRIRPPQGRLVFYEDNIIDGRVPIEMMQSNAIKQALAALDHLPDTEEFTYIDSNLPIRLDPTDLRISIAPDYYRARGVDVSRIRDDTGYNLWEIGKPPEWVLEVASRSAYRKDLYEKPAIYAGIGVSELWMFDPTGGELYGQALIGFKMVEGEYEPVDISTNEHGLPSGYSDELGLRICALEWSKRDELLRVQPNLNLVISANYQPWQLMFQDADTGLYLINMRTAITEYRQAEAERQRLEAEHESERTRAEQAEAERGRAEQSLADERAAHDETRTALQQRDARIRELEDRLRQSDG